jgi:putative copper resistance protein D
VSLNAWDAALIAVKTITYAATLGAAGAAFFLGYSGALVASADSRRIRRVAVALAALGVFAGALQIMVSAGSLGGDAAGMLDGTLIHMVWDTGANRSYSMRAAGLLLLALGVFADRAAWPAFVGGVAAATSFAWTGHVHSLSPAMLPMVLLGVHVLGVAFWMGGLAPLLIVSRSGDSPRTAAIVARFGRLALFVVAGLLAAGICVLSLLLGGIGELWSSAYGRCITLKLGLVVCLLCLAVFNKLHLTPRLHSGDAAAARILRASLWLEMSLGGLILAVTATLTTSAGPPALG